jgi:DNA-binding protein H-NS
MTTGKRETLQELIEKRERELQALRADLRTRQEELAILADRKEKLMNELRQVEEEINLLVSVTPPPSPDGAAPQSPPPTTSEPYRTAVSADGGQKKIRLFDLLVVLLLMALRR